MGKIPDSLVINWDQIGIQYIPENSRTMEKEGATRVEITGLKDKRQITSVFAASKDGYFLPSQVIYQGKTDCFFTCNQIPSGRHITYTANHWANEKTTLA